MCLPHSTFPPQHLPSQLDPAQPLPPLLDPAPTAQPLPLPDTSVFPGLRGCRVPLLTKNTDVSGFPEVGVLVEEDGTVSRFDEAAATWDDDAKLERTRRAAALLLTRLELGGDEHVLDVGAGTGQLSIHLADAVGSVLVSDASAGMVAQAGANISEAGLADRFTAAQLDLTSDETLESGSFDGAWSMLALHHVPALEELLARVHDVVRPGGWVAIIDLDHDVDGAFHAHVGDDFDGHHGFNRDHLAGLLERAGFTDVAITDAGVVDKELESDGHGHEGQTRSFPMFLATARRA